MSRKANARRVHQVFAEYLSGRGFRLTKQRTRILDCLLAADRHMNIEDIYQSVRRHGLGRATVFRTLKMLEECRLISRVTGVSGPAGYELEIERPHHDHLICMGCRRILEVSWPELEGIQQKACGKLGFKPVWHRHEVFGWCSECRRRKSDRP